MLLKIFETFDENCLNMYNYNTNASTYKQFILNVFDYASTTNKKSGFYSGGWIGNNYYIALIAVTNISNCFGIINCSNHLSICLYNGNNSANIYDCTNTVLQ